MPLSHPVYAVNGFMTSDPFAPEAPQVSVYPPELAPEFRDFIADVTEYPDRASYQLTLHKANPRVYRSQREDSALAGRDGIAFDEELALGFLHGGVDA